MKKSMRVKTFSLQVKLTKLKINHGVISAKIAKELKRPVPCTIALQVLKKRRLHLKDQMVRCIKTLHAFGHAPKAVEARA